jgi:type IV pilus assembly protein PilQ
MSLLVTLRKRVVKINQAVLVLLIILGAGIIACSNKNMKADYLKTQKMLVSKMEYNKYPDKSKFVIAASDILKYTIFKTSNPDRVNIEIYDAHFEDEALNSIRNVSDETVKAITLSDSPDKNKSNLVIMLANDTEYNVIPDGKELMVEFKSGINLKKESFVIGNDDSKKNFTVITADSNSIDKRRKTILSERNITDSSMRYAKIDTIDIDDTLNGLSVTIAGEGALDDYATLELADPARLVLDIWDSKSVIKENPVLVASNSIDSINVIEQKDKVRFVFNSKDEKVPQYDINTNTNNIVVAFREAGTPAAAPEEKTETAPEGSAAAEEPAPEEKTETVPEAAAPAAAPAAAAAAPETKAEVKPGAKLVMTALDFKYEEKTSKVVIVTNAEPAYEVNEGVEGKIIIDIANVRLPKKISRPLDTSQFSSNITYIEPKVVGDNVSLEITLKEDVPYNIVQNENTVYLEIENPFEIVEKVETKVVEKEVKVVKEVKKVEKKKVVEADIPEAADVPKSAREDQRLLLEEIKQAYLDIGTLGEEEEEDVKTFTGKRMSLDFKDADIHNVLRLIAEVSGFNVITSDEVSGKVSIHLSDVPWDQALDVILNVKSLGMIKQDNILLIVPQAKIRAARERKASELKARKEEKLEEIKRKKKDLEDLKPVELKVIQANYAQASELEPQIKSILSDRGSISVDERMNVLIVKDIAENLEEAEEMVKRLDVETPQVLIEARIVEASTNFTRQLGIQWGTAYNMGPQYGNAPRYDFPNSISVIPADPTTGYNVDLPASVSQSSGGAIGLSLGHIANTLTLDMRLSAMENSGEGKIVSSPRIFTLDNEEAIIRKGTSIPYESTSEGGTETEFVDANLMLKVTPHITADKRVFMDLVVQKNAPNLSIISNGEPAIDKNEAITEVLVQDGETIVIGGIFVIEESTSEGGVPFLKELPLIGWLFRTNQKIKSRSELLIFITPRIQTAKKLTAEK